MAEIKKIGVIGAGNMGSGIAQKIAQEGISVVMLDVKEEFVKRGLDNIRKTLEAGVEKKIFKPEQVGEILSRLTGTTDMKELADADIVIEAVFEDKQVKTDLFQKLDKVVSSKTILATNTSSFFVRDFAAKVSHPERFVGLHYFYHPAKNRLLEVIPHEGTNKETVEKSLLAAKLHGKTAILVKDAPGFAVNRFFVPFLNEAVRMLEEGLANIPTIEEASKKAFKIGMGPFELMNVTGIPIAVHSSATLGRELGPFYETAPLMKKQMDKKENWNLAGNVEESKLQPVIDRFQGVCLGVAAALADEKVASIEDIDRGAKIGLRWLLGPFEIMNKIGIEKAFTLVEAVTKKYPDFKMPETLASQKKLGKPFEFRVVDLEVKGEIAIITINRPEAMNALNEMVVAQLDKQFTAAEKNPAVKAIVLQGAGKAFVAGADIRFFVTKIKENKIPDIVSFTRKGHELLMRIESSKKLTVALLTGLSLGGGSELALSCQSIVATPAGSMAFPETGIGIYPGLGGMFRMSKKVGRELAKYFVFTGSTISAKDASALGIVTKLVEPAEVMNAVNALVKECSCAHCCGKGESRAIPDKFKGFAAMFTDANAKNILSGKSPEGVDAELAGKTLKYVSFKAPAALRISNELIDAQAGKSSKDAAELELGRLTEIFSTKDAYEGLSTVGKGRPQFKGQ